MWSRVPYLRSFEVMGIKQVIIGVKTKMKLEVKILGTSSEEMGNKETIFGAITKLEAMSHETSLEVMGIKKAFFEAMDKKIFGVKCLEHLG